MNAEKFNLSASAVGMILTKRNEFEAELSQGINPKRKRIRTMQKTAELNQRIVEIVGKCNAKGIPVSGVQIREAAKDVALKLGVQNFGANQGWLQKLADRNNLTFKTVCGESAGVDKDASNRWILEIQAKSTKEDFRSLTHLTSMNLVCAIT